MNRLEQSTHSQEKFGHNHKNMYSGTLSYYAFTVNSLKETMKEILWISKEELQCDAFSAQTIMDNKSEMYEDLGFLKGDGANNYYIVNWSFGDT